MNIKNGLILLVGALLGILSLGIFTILLGGSSFKDWFPSFVTGIVTLAALLFGYLNNKEQRKVQLATTVEKEWFEQVRKHLSVLLTQAYPVAMGRIMTNQHKSMGDSKEKYESGFYEFFSSKSSLACYLDKNKPIESKLLNAVNKLAYFVFQAKEDKDIDAVSSASNEVITEAHTLFDSKRI